MKARLRIKNARATKRIRPQNAPYVPKLLMGY
jgi:hypothetical protein